MNYFAEFILTLLYKCKKSSCLTQRLIHSSAIFQTVLTQFVFVSPQEELMNNTELVQSYRQQINNTINQFNLQLFWNMYNRCRNTVSHPHTHINTAHIKNTQHSWCVVSFSRRDLEMNRSGTVLNAKTLKWACRHSFTIQYVLYIISLTFILKIIVG